IYTQLPSPSYFFSSESAPTQIYTLSLHDALPISGELLHRGEEAEVVAHRRHVVQPVGVRQALRPGGVLAALLEAPVEEADLRIELGDDLAVELDVEEHRAVGRRVRGPQIEAERPRRELRLEHVLRLTELRVLRLRHSRSPRSESYLTMGSCEGRGSAARDAGRDV